MTIIGPRVIGDGIVTYYRVVNVYPYSRELLDEVGHRPLDSFQMAFACRPSEDRESKGLMRAICGLDGEKPVNGSEKIWSDLWFKLSNPHVEVLDPVRGNWRDRDGVLEDPYKIHDRMDYALNKVMDGDTAALRRAYSVLLSLGIPSEHLSAYREIMYDDRRWHDCLGADIERIKARMEGLR